MSVSFAYISDDLEIQDVCPGAIIRLAKKVFFQLHLRYKFKVGLSRHILLLSCSIKENAPILPILALLVNVLAFYNFYGLFEKFPDGLIS